MSAVIENQIEEQPLTNEQVAALGVKGTAGAMRQARDFFNKQRDKLFNIIIRTAGEGGIREAYKETNSSVQFPYYAIKSKYTTKKGKEMDCWKSAYGKYAGKWVEGKPAPILNGWKGYNSFLEKELIWDEWKKKFWVDFEDGRTLELGCEEVQLAYTQAELDFIREHEVVGL